MSRARFEELRAAHERDHGCGVADPDVVVEEVPELSRQVSGKLKRFVPL